MRLLKASGCHVEHGRQQVSVLPKPDLAERQHVSVSPSVVPERRPPGVGETAAHAKGSSVAFYAGHESSRDGPRLELSLMPASLTLIRLPCTATQPK